MPAVETCSIISTAGSDQALLSLMVILPQVAIEMDPSMAYKHPSVFNPVQSERQDALQLMLYGTEHGIFLSSIILSMEFI